MSATWVLKYQQEKGGDELMGELFRQSDPACFMHAAVCNHIVCPLPTCYVLQLHAEEAVCMSKLSCLPCIVFTAGFARVMTPQPPTQQNQAEWCEDRAAGPSHRLPVFHDFFQGEGYEHEWVDAARFPHCRVGCRMHVCMCVCVCIVMIVCAHAPCFPH